MIPPHALALVVLVGCSAAADPSRPAAQQEPATDRPAAATAPRDQGPPPERDCTLLAPAIERILAAEIATIERDRPREVRAAATAEAQATSALLVAVLPARCEADGWSGAYTACVAAAATRDDARACDVHLTADQTRALGEAIRQTAGAPSTIGIAECDEWERTTLALATCGKLPVDSQQALAKAVEQTMDAWRTQAADAASRTSIQTACRAALDATKQSLRSLGCAAP